MVEGGDAVEAESSGRSRRVNRQMTFWQDGFSIDDGPLYRYDDPANQSYLEIINRGEAPMDLLNVERGQPVSLGIVRRTHEAYQPSSGAVFGGAGQRLGAPTPAVAISSSSTGVSTSTSASPASMQVDPDAPVTSIQVRLADGTRMIIKANHTHTVGDIRQFICASRPSEEASAFALQSTFPTTVLSDDSQTLADAKLLNAVIVQKRLA
ncbi:SEP domain-containing protein [Piptocephalis cylindrospora]|uniref:SEP domain-containing protein n=1 Tax=Piptocephalis cylindrospora TaxID=1907219 RepID=A0A4P9Y1P3_9FUNG|nr:SEP domain-containing protein [Piptocephalis cylindrospora]|eukprot:RKP12748.1 SEP domain-containing protein [Piptocephalis cylindrospora]